MKPLNFTEASKNIFVFHVFINLFINHLTLLSGIGLITLAFGSFLLIYPKNLVRSESDEMYNIQEGPGERGSVLQALKNLSQNSVKCSLLMYFIPCTRGSVGVGWKSQYNGISSAHTYYLYCFQLEPREDNRSGCSDVNSDLVLSTSRFVTSNEVYRKRGS